MRQETRKIVGLPAFVLLAVVCLAVAGCGEQSQNETNGEVPRNVRILELAPETVAEFFEIAGPVAPVRGTDLSAQESGPVVALPADKGQAVAKGKTLLVIERDILAAELEAAKAALSLEAYNVDKVKQLHEAGKVSRIELLTAESRHAGARSRVEVLRERYDRAGIKAPFDGVLVDRYVELGELVNPGQRVARILDPYTLKLEAYLTDSQVQWVAVGDRATIKMGESRDRAHGQVSWVGFEADRMTGKFKVEIEIPNRDLKFHSGVIGRARLEKNLMADVVAVPRDAILPGRTGPVAYVVIDDRAVLARLKLGEDQGVMVVVTNGLKPGDRLVVRGHRDLRDGSLVRVTETATAADGTLDGDPTEVYGAGSGTRIQDSSEVSGKAISEDGLEDSK
ncbi:MAG: efflux RND transporter periplasmic adaptor subunit [Candidatus Krumholzibacteriota bacterium]